MASLIARLGVIALCIVGAAFGARTVGARWFPLLLPSAGGRALPGLRIDGAPLGSRQPVRPWVEARALALRDRPVRLIVGREGAPALVVESTFGALGVGVDVDEVTASALRLGRTGDWLGRARLADRASHGRLDVPMAPTVDVGVAMARLLPLKEDLDVPPVAARLAVERHAVVGERLGRALDVDGAIAAIARAARDPSVLDVSVPFVSVAPRTTSASLAGLDASRVLASFATYFSRRGDQAPRAQNIEVAAAHVDGVVIEPGEVVSFNDLVGARSLDNGFQKAFEIYKGEMVEGTGGGTCQVASTLHAIAFFGGLDIVQRLPHSRPSPYIPVGLDATVVYPVVDLKIRNPYAFPVVVHATVGLNRVAMQLLGADKPVRVALMRTVLGTTPFERMVVEDPTIGVPKRKQRGIDGMRLLRKRVIAPRGGPSRVETSHDSYPPTAEIWKVPLGYDAAGLPPLGEDFPDSDNPYPSSPPPPRAGDPEQTLWGQ